MKKLLAAAILSALLLVMTSCSGTEPETVPEYITDLEPDREEIAAMYPALSNVPVIYIDIDRDLQAVSREEYVNATVTVPESGIIEADAMIKGRGNASWSLPQRPYNIKFNRAADVFGMGSAKKWVLITLFYDKTLLRNYLTLNLAQRVAGSQEMDCRFAEVVINGEYNGLYLITEKIEDDKNRVDLKKKDGDVLFEIEQGFRHNNDCSECIVFRSGAHLMFKDPEPDDLTEDEFSELYRKMYAFLKEADDAIRNGGYDDYSKYIDVDSFVNWYIVNEFVKNYDSQFVTSCYCYVRDGRLYMGPCWDYDTCYGNQDVASCLSPEGYHVRNSPWFIRLMRDPDFSRLVCERWNELVSEGVFSDLLKSVDEQTEYLKDASANQFERWPGSLRSTDLRGRRALFTYRAEIDYLKNWINSRIDWLNANWVA